MDLEELCRDLKRRLPLHARWEIGDITCDWDFSRVLRELVPVSAAEVPFHDVDEAGLLYVFAERDFGRGGGAHPLVAVHAHTGEVFQVDCERERAISPLNSSVQGFLSTFLLFDAALRGQSTVDLAARVLGVDPRCHKDSDWFLAAEYLGTLEGGEARRTS